MPTITRHGLLDEHLAGQPAVDRVKIARIELDPGQATGRHRHPCPVIGYVAAGTIRLQVADRPQQLLRPGDAFYEPANTEIPHFDNASSTEPATFIACYLLSSGETRLIEMLDHVPA